MTQTNPNIAALQRADVALRSSLTAQREGERVQVVLRRKDARELREVIAKLIAEGYAV